MPTPHRLKKEKKISEKVPNAHVLHSREYSDAMYSRTGNTVGLFYLEQPPWDHDDISWWMAQSWLWSSQGTSNDHAWRESCANPLTPTCIPPLFSAKCRHGNRSSFLKMWEKERTSSNGTQGPPAICRVKLVPHILNYNSSTLERKT